MSILSNSLDRVGKRLIGRYELVSYIGLPGLGMRVISEIFHALGKCSRRRIALNIDAMSAIPFMGSSLILLHFLLGRDLLLSWGLGD